MQVLKTIPFEKVDISVLLIEVDHLGEIFEGDDDEMRKFMHENSCMKMDMCFIEGFLLMMFM